MIDDFVPCCYFPTKILLVDDNRRFLTNLAFKLDKNINHEIQTKPANAIKFFLEKYNPENLVKKCIFEPIESETDEEKIAQHMLGVDINNIHHQINNPNRFDVLSTLLVDYAMPGMNGIDFCNRIKHIPIKKIMVTGEADYDIAVKGFNEGLIDKFILKDDEDFFGKISCMIEDMQRTFFKELSKVIIAGITVGRSSCLVDPVFISFFKKICLEKEIVEYYLIDSSGSFLLLDKYANFIWLIVKSPKEINDYYDIAKQSGNANSIANVLKRKEKIPFFYSEEDSQVPVSEWGSYLFPAKILRGESEYYYALIEDLPISKIRHETIVSYEKYMKDK